jgi:hypothetical protein
MQLPSFVAAPLVAAFSLAFGSSAFGQDLSSKTNDVPKTEFGGHVVGLQLQTPLFGGGVRASRRMSSRFSLEVEVDKFRSPRARHADAVTGIYLIKAKHQLASLGHGRTSLFLTYGATGWFARTWRPPGLDRQPDGTFLRRPERWGTEIVVPVLPVMGFAGQHALTPHLAFRVEAQLIFGPYEDMLPVIGRVSTGVSVPIGRYRN